MSFIRFCLYKLCSYICTGAHVEGNALRCPLLGRSVCCLEISVIEDKKSELQTLDLNSKATCITEHPGFLGDTEVWSGCSSCVLCGLGFDAVLTTIMLHGKFIVLTLAVTGLKLVSSNHI